MDTRTENIADAIRLLADVLETLNARTSKAGEHSEFQSVNEMIARARELLTE